MNGSMISAMVSMSGLQQKLDVMSDNIANSNTVGYKRKEASFEDLLTNAKQQSDDFKEPGRLSPMNYTQGWGSRMLGITPDLSQGTLQQTGNTFDIAIEGDALFQVQTPGGTGYTRNGAFQLSLQSDGTALLATSDGYPVIGEDDQPIVIPPNYSIRVNVDGTLDAVAQDGTAESIGRLKLLQVTRPSQLTSVADNLYAVADGVNVEDVLRTVNAGEGNDISLHQGYLEQSNVDLTTEMTELINVQRAYQLTSRALSSSDTLMGLANGLRA
ncbi:flagellar basal-body rod protein FlgG [Paenibacillus cellulosilyticus]|uniref:Flagellar basal-body rod protein FlgG n=1 Tax=Paenibacillus cellulosilyticus TaxID=375489 RepID=A0A2V2YZZ8_9BACL|nr:flagellar basal-body rod protein FlgF [Paenibacillus cellulosilyticus]PWW08384.1 flagellar basal-body rod protein FlgG [Paenibacillus cellulosilyticus]QKS47977.1 flagellar basal-body rod protein FlgF [Paenibacillus cellulosilyticus]